MNNFHGFLTRDQIEEAIAVGGVEYAAQLVSDYVTAIGIFTREAEGDVARLEALRNRLLGLRTEAQRESSPARPDEPRSKPRTG
ncbi:hypothetical protein DEJ51_00185 [Streptomyces venezuelae]|uniref:Uncharacterized protein n=1 Tax=Streptomyces venezuelae TaxID=54571 RepID=A0A5P2DCJ5_STRVZ|nr:hypothetical protein [Streptomyces venezuelae]QES52884.1 hypothetical protein DEJ51_00185 [Streptomyces venezuelae]